MERLTYTVCEVAELLGISRSKAYDLVAAGLLPFVPLPGRRKLVARTVVERLVNASEPAAAGRTAATDGDEHANGCPLASTAHAAGRPRSRIASEWRALPCIRKAPVSPAFQSLIAVLDEAPARASVLADPTSGARMAAPAPPGSTSQPSRAIEIGFDSAPGHRGGHPCATRRWSLL
jgi:excisionase family DNA binding protein